MSTLQTSFKPLLLGGEGGRSRGDCEYKEENLCSNYVQEFNLGERQFTEIFSSFVIGHIAGRFWQTLALGWQTRLFRGNQISVIKLYVRPLV